MCYYCYVFLRFFENKNVTFYVFFALLHTFSRTMISKTKATLTRHVLKCVVFMHATLADLATVGLPPTNDTSLDRYDRYDRAGLQAFAL